MGGLLSPACAAADRRQTRRKRRASDTTNNYEEIVLAAPVTGTYYLRVFSLANDVSSRYSLNVQIQ